MNKKILFILVSVIIFAPVVRGVQAGKEPVMEITNPDFRDNEFMPEKFTCRGEGVNPALIIDDIPKGAKSLALIADDPDAPAGIFVHWVVYNIPVVNRIEENSVPGKQGLNTSGGEDYVSPCPPYGTHRYFFKVYALDGMLDLSGAISRKDLEKAMQGHILGKAELVGLVKK